MSAKLLLILGLMFNINTSDTPIFYESFQSSINEQPLYINCLIVDMNNEAIQVTSALSKEVIYGFEETSKMAERNEALVAVNGTFFDDYGHHIGGMMIEEEWITLPDPNLPTVILTDDNRITIDDTRVSAYLEHGNKKYPIDGLNRYAYGEELLLFTPMHGSTTRIYSDAVNYIIDEDKVIDIIHSEEPVGIEEGTIVLVDIGGKAGLALNVDNEIRLTYEGLEDENTVELFQASSYLVKDGENVAKIFDPIIGLTTNREPRTLLGVTENNKLVILVVDGRKPGISVGLTGHEAAELMMEFGCTDAVLLDGGASSTMIVEEVIVNHLANEKERIVGHSIIIKIQE
ncbi:phosphodiester glycosidase family protein [Vallitalea okinawensis]|uniref:phosphodiester glycosidase family protein n=1 Tax=Vallitalea okinawensis TaxID=2078660 RepID=UPI0013002627|nr:phosphodiester glycosidase family protein [Vallitalea okinawensis]